MERHGNYLVEQLWTWSMGDAVWSFKPNNLAGVDIAVNIALPDRSEFVHHTSLPKYQMDQIIERGWWGLTGLLWQIDFSVRTSLKIPQYP